jgi:hypothetical protein
LRRFAFVLGSLAVAVTASPAWAGPDSDVTSAFDPGDGFDLHLTFDYQLDVHRAAIRREAAGRPGTAPTDPVPVVDDLVFSSTKHTVVPKLELGLFHDVSASFAVPLVLAWDRSLELDQRDTPCTFDVPGASCVSRMSSSTLADGLLPTVGYDGQHGGAGFSGTDPTVFRGPTRAGVDQVHLGLTWAPMNQLRDDTKPTWKLGAELRLAAGKVMAMNRLDPSASTGVGRGFTSSAVDVDRLRMGWAEPFVDLVAGADRDRAPARRSRARFGALDRSSQRAGARFGFEACRGRSGRRRRAAVAELSAHLDGHFEAASTPEMWRCSRLAGDASTTGRWCSTPIPPAPGCRRSITPASRPSRTTSTSGPGSPAGSRSASGSGSPRSSRCWPRPSTC